MYPFSVLRFFRVVSRVAVLFLTICGCCALNAQALDEAPKPPSNRVYSYDMNDGFGLENYESAVESVLGLFEESKGEAYMPQTKGRVGIKVYSDSGAGLSTPEALVEAVVGALERRGYERSQIFILGLSGHTLRDAGFLPPLSRRSVYFNQVFVESLDTGLYYHSDWFYDSPLPSPFENLQIEVDEDSGRVSGVKERVERKSLLPMPLMHEVDFWINMPCYSDHPTLGVNGALMNATMWNASNTMRFLNNPASASVAVAEMGAIPELRETWALNIVSLERYQFIGGPIFNSLYTVSEPVLLLSDNPVMLDSLMKEKINIHRLKNGFAPLAKELKILAYSEQLGLGERDTSRVNLIKAN